MTQGYFDNVLHRWLCWRLMNWGSLLNRFVLMGLSSNSTAHTLPKFGSERKKFQHVNYSSYSNRANVNQRSSSSSSRKNLVAYWGDKVTLWNAVTVERDAFYLPAEYTIWGDLGGISATPTTFLCFVEKWCQHCKWMISLCLEECYENSRDHSLKSYTSQIMAKNDLLKSYSFVATSNYL